MGDADVSGAKDARRNSDGARKERAISPVRNSNKGLLLAGHFEDHLAEQTHDGLGWSRLEGDRVVDSSSRGVKVWVSDLVCVDSLVRAS